VIYIKSYHVNVILIRKRKER